MYCLFNSLFLYEKCGFISIPNIKYHSLGVEVKLIHDVHSYEGYRDEKQIFSFHCG